MRWNETSQLITTFGHSYSTEDEDADASDDSTNSDSDSGEVGSRSSSAESDSGSGEGSGTCTVLAEGGWWGSAFFLTEGDDKLMLLCGILRGLRTDLVQRGSIGRIQAPRDLSIRSHPISIPSHIGQ